MEVKPLYNRVIVKRSVNETVTASGIVLTNEGPQPDQGVVVSVGPGRKDKDGNLLPMNVKVGDTVIFEHLNYPTINVDGEELLVMIEDVITAVLEP